MAPLRLAANRWPRRLGSRRPPPRGRSWRARNSYSAQVRPLSGSSSLSTGSASLARGSRWSTTTAGPIRSRPFSRRRTAVPAERRSIGSPGPAAPQTTGPDLRQETEDARARRRHALPASRSDPRRGKSHLTSRVPATRCRLQAAPTTRDRPKVLPPRSSRRRRLPLPRPRRRPQRACSLRSTLRSFPSYRPLPPYRQCRTCRRRRCRAFRRPSSRNCREKADAERRKFFASAAPHPCQRE